MEVVSHMEMIDIYDEIGQKSGRTLEIYEAHKRGAIHKGVCVWIINSKDEILIQTRNDKGILKNMKDISFSGHIKSGETSIEAAIREGKEELGIDLELDKLKFLFTCREYGELDGYIENEIDDVFLYRKDILFEDCSFSDNEVKDVSYVSLEKFKEMVETKSDMLVPYKNHYIFLLRALGK